MRDNSLNRMTDSPRGESGDPGRHNSPDRPVDSMPEKFGDPGRHDSPDRPADSMPEGSVSPGRRPFWARTAGVLALLVMAAAVLSIILGPVRLDPGTVLRVLAGGDADSTAARIILYSRLPRTLGCLLAGCALALSGAVIQTVLHNPLAAPNIIGVNSGAGFAVVLYCALLPGHMGGLQAAACTGGFLGVLLVLVIGERTGASRLTLVLAGIAVSAIFSGAADLVITLVPDALSGYTDFRIGGFSSLTMARVVPAAILILPAAVLSFLLAGRAEILSLGEDTARSLGLRVRPLRILLLACAAVLAAAAVTVSGLLGFVGLIVPHAVRKKTRGEIFPLFLLSALGGAVFVTAADLAARVLFSPYEIPVGIVLTLCGGPFFLWLVLGSRRRR